MITRAPRTATTTTGAELVMVTLKMTGITAALHCGGVRLKMGSTAAVTVLVQNTAIASHGATRMMARKTSAALLMTVSQL